MKFFTRDIVKTMCRLFGPMLLIFIAGCAQEPTAPVQPGTGVPHYQWTFSTPMEQGIDSLLVDSAVAAMASDEQWYAFVMVRNGKLVREYYRQDLRSFHEFEIRSVTKSVLSVLTGIALRRGWIDSLDQPMLSFFPEFDHPSLDPRTRTITIRHLLSMRAGFDHTDADPAAALFTTNDHWVKKTIELPLKYAPGERFYYCSLQTHLISAIIAQRSGMNTLECARRYLLDPAGIRIGRWDRDPQGVYFGGSGMTMTARDMARFGEIVRRSIDGDSVVIPSGWMKASVSPNNAVNSAWGDVAMVNYGFSWWVDAGSTDSLFFAAGSGGQYIFIHPRKQAVIVTAADPNRAPEEIAAQEDRIFRTVHRYLLPALR